MTMGKILIVDDDQSHVRYLADLLGFYGYDVESAGDGSAGIAKALEVAPDLILLDIMMPGMNGFEVTATLKNNPAICLTPIVLMTSLDGKEEKAKGLDAGADDFLTKPVDRTELKVRIRSLIKMKFMTDQLRSAVTSVELTHTRLSQVSKSSKSRIMIVEDDENAAKLYRAMLIPEGYESVLAKNAAEACLLLEKLDIDMILLDLMLPDISGIEILKTVRGNQNSSTRDIPIIIISSISSKETIVAAIENGADDYLVKPINCSEMLARIRTNLRRQLIKHKLEDERELFFNEAVTDALTGLYNRHYLDSVMERAVCDTKRFGWQYWMLMLDIDDFKIINDSLGHLAGDSVLKELGEILLEKVRKNDVAARYGGDEFAIILTGIDIEGISFFAERVRADIESHHFKDIGERRITFSIGATEFRTDDPGMEEIIKRADDALYAAKLSGKNMVRVVE